MKADVSYNDFIGTAAADISDFLGSKFGDDLDSFGKYFKVDETRFRVIGISIYGTDSFSISLLCVDKKKSKDGHDHIVSMRYDIDDDKLNLNMLFKRLHIVLHERSDKKYPDLHYNEEVRFSDFHDVPNKDINEEE
ncbi:MAG: hypothetical protein WCL51_05630 [Bacteroidota bacterium]